MDTDEYIDMSEVHVFSRDVKEMTTQHEIANRIWTNGNFIHEMKTLVYPKKYLEKIYQVHVYLLKCEK